MGFLEAGSKSSVDVTIKHKVAAVAVNSNNIKLKKQKVSL